MGRLVACVSALAASVACGRQSGPPAEPVAGIPLNHQRQISRADLIDHWPFVPGTGTLACDQDAIAFRVQGVTYALNDAARARGYANVDPLVVSRSAEPSQPLRRIAQDARMRIFADAAACASAANSSQCRLDVTAAHQLTSDELNQIDREGLERSWPPLTAAKQSVKPVVDLGLALCAR